MTNATTKLNKIIRGWAEDNGYDHEYVRGCVYGIAATREQLRIKKAILEAMK